MTAMWYENLKARGEDVEAYVTKRHDAYLDRWREAARFIPQNARILDVGGGNLFPRLLNFFKENGYQYYYMDVDPEAVENSRALATAAGLRGDFFKCGFNDQYDYPNGFFDCVFSSHCLEHSIDLKTTFRELNRIIRTDGFLLMAVPFGWEQDNEHPYFFSPEQWLALVEDYGFEIRVAQVGREYPESGYDYFIAAKRINSPHPTPRIDPTLYKKETYSFISHMDPSIKYAGDQERVAYGAATLLLECNWSIRIHPQQRCSVILPIFMNHNWSGKIEISSANNFSTYDLFSWFPFVQPCMHPMASVLRDDLTIRPVGRNPSSWSTQACLYGYMIR